MKRRKLAVAPEAIEDLQDIYDWIAGGGSPVTARRYVARIWAFLRTLTTFPQRGNDHREIRPGLRSVGFERRAQIVFEVRDEVVIIVRVFRGGQNWLRYLGGDSEG